MMQLDATSEAAQTSFNYTTYAVGDPAFGRAVLYLLLGRGFCARRAQKPRPRSMGSTLLPQARKRLN